MATTETSTSLPNLDSLTLDESAIQEEIDLLEAIYINELKIERSESGQVRSLTLLLHPATGDNVDLQYVCLTLHFFLQPDYPLSIPDMVIQNPRGLGDEHLNSLRQSLHALAEDCKGGPMLYELIEHVKESLTEANVPHGQCVICLGNFESGDNFTKTECYHYFHCGCLLRYIRHSLQEFASEEQEAQLQPHLHKEEKKVVCPVCREPITYDLILLEQMPSPPEEQEKYHLSSEIRQMQQKMAILFADQKAKGGIIDLEEEKNKFLIPQSGVIVFPANETTQSQMNSVPQPDYCEARQSQVTKEQCQGRSKNNFDIDKKEKQQGQQGKGHQGRSRDRHEEVDDRGQREQRRDRKDDVERRDSGRRDDRQYGSGRGQRLGHRSGGYGRYDDYRRRRHSPWRNAKGRGESRDRPRSGKTPEHFWDKNCKPSQESHQKRENYNYSPRENIETGSTWNRQNVVDNGEASVRESLKTSTHPRRRGDRETNRNSWKQNSDNPENSHINDNEGRKSYHKEKRNFESSGSKSARGPPPGFKGRGARPGQNGNTPSGPPPGFEEIR